MFAILEKRTIHKYLRKLLLVNLINKISITKWKISYYALYERNLCSLVPS